VSSQHGDVKSGSLTTYTWRAEKRKGKTHVGSSRPRAGKNVELQGNLKSHGDTLTVNGPELINRSFVETFTVP